MTRIAIIGGGPAGIMAALFAAQNPDNQIYIFDKGIILNTLLPTGGGRCNLAHAEYDFKALTKFYPRGEKFLYSIFSRFCTAETIEFFEKIGVKTYTQPDNRIFPKSDSAKDVKEALLNEVSKYKNIKKVFEEVVEIKKINNTPNDCHPELAAKSVETLSKRDFMPLSGVSGSPALASHGPVSPEIPKQVRNDSCFLVKTNKQTHNFDKIIIATGGRGNGQKLAKSLGHNITELRPALCSLKTVEKDFSEISGISIKNLSAEVFFENKKIKTLTGDFLFTHTGVSGPLVYKISSHCAFLDFNQQNPLKISVNLIGKSFEDFDKEFLEVLKTKAQKDIGNVLPDYLPKNLALAILKKLKINTETKSGQLTKNDRQNISKNVTGLIFNAIATTKGEEIVTAGGVDLKEVNPKTLESKLVEGLYFCGEVLDIDGLTGGFNLQNCWSTGFVVGSALK